MVVLDINGDGTLDAREIQSAPMSLRKLDTNKDFKLTPDELGARGGGNMTDRMMELDKNKDGKITSDEVPERMQRFIERMDTNGDGTVDKVEIEVFQTEMQNRFQNGGGRGGPGQGGPGGPGRGAPPED
jgi:Ca2+-binding EF-hand superfamily protein